MAKQSAVYFNGAAAIERTQRRPNMCSMILTVNRMERNWVNKPQHCKKDADERCPQSTCTRQRTGPMIRTTPVHSRCRPIVQEIYLLFPKHFSLTSMENLTRIHEHENLTAHRLDYVRMDNKVPLIHSCCFMQDI